MNTCAMNDNVLIMESRLLSPSLMRHTNINSLSRHELQSDIKLTNETENVQMLLQFIGIILYFCIEQIRSLNNISYINVYYK